MIRERLHPPALVRRTVPVQPERLQRPASFGFVWGTVLFAWLISLLPWRLWQGAPDLLLVVMVFWFIHEPRRIGMFTAFVLGLTLDVHDASLLGERALQYTLVAYGAWVLHRRLQRFDLWSQAMHMLPILLGAQLVALVLRAWLAGAWPGWMWALGATLTALLLPLVGWLLHLPQHGDEDGDGAAV